MINLLKGLFSDSNEDKEENIFSKSDDEVPEESENKSKNDWEKFSTVEDKEEKSAFEAAREEAKSNEGLKLSESVSSGYANPQDTAKVKYGLNRTGYYNDDISTIPNQKMLDGVKSFQKDNNLRIDGRLNPTGETITAINEKMKEKQMNRSKYVVGDILNNMPFARIGEFIADSQIAYEHLKEMKKTNAKLIDKYGKFTGAADGTDDYYHPLLQCHLSKISPKSRSIGLFLGYGKEVYDCVKKKIIGNMSDKDIVKDSIKDLKNNYYGSRLGAINSNKSCRELLDDKRTEKMRKNNLW